MILRFLILALISLSPGFSCVNALASNKLTPLAVIELTPHPGGTAMMTIRAKVRGHEGVFIFDTGGGVSYLSTDFARSVGCKPWGQITGFTLTGQRLDMPRCDGLSFDLQGHSFAGPIFGVFDIMKFMPPNVPRIDGSIGLDVLSEHAITLSLSQKTLTVESSASLAARAKRSGKFLSGSYATRRRSRALRRVAVFTPEGMAWMELDSGNGGATVIGKHLAALLKLDASKKEPQPASFQIAGGIPVEGMARVNETLIMDGNIGTRFMLKWDLTLDLSKGRAWLAPATVS